MEEGKDTPTVLGKRPCPEPASNAPPTTETASSPITGEEEAEQPKRRTRGEGEEEEEEEKHAAGAAFLTSSRFAESNSPRLSPLTLQHLHVPTPNPMFSQCSCMHTSILCH